MKNWILKTLLTALAVVFIAWMLPGISVQAGFTSAIFVAILLGLLNSTIKPILIILTLPVTIVTLGLFMWVINAFMVVMAGWWLDGFTVDSFFWALIFSGLLSVINSFLYRNFVPENKKFTYTQRENITNKNVHYTETGNKVSSEDGKKTIIIEKD